MTIQVVQEVRVGEYTMNIIDLYSITQEFFYRR